MAPSPSALAATATDPVTLVSDGDQLHAAVLRSPDDDAPRLAYADWLDENSGAEPCPQFGYDEGESHFQCARCQGRGVVPNGNAERAEFIRVQIELARIERVLCHQPGAKLGDGCNDSLCPRCGPEHVLADRELALLYSTPPGVDLTNKYFWFDPAPGGGEWKGVGHEWRRGFVEKIEASAAQWIAYGDALIRRHPVREVTLTTWPNWATITYGNEHESAWLGDVYLADMRRRWPSVKTWNLPPASPEPVLDYRGALDLERMRRVIERGIVGRYSDHLPLRPPGG